ncbi:hypothetical protein J6590_004297 [Homalodisca vitripennis]|nr:hypothetical protein J6590_004297 [Homalodisca vitripennis]
MSFSNENRRGQTIDQEYLGLNYLRRSNPTNGRDYVSIIHHRYVSVDCLSMIRKLGVSIHTRVSDQYILCTYLHVPYNCQHTPLIARALSHFTIPGSITSRPRSRIIVIITSAVSEIYVRRRIKPKLMFVIVVKIDPLCCIQCVAQCSEYGGYRKITVSSNVERGCCLDEWLLSDPVLASSPPARPLVVVRKSPSNRWSPGEVLKRAN